MSASRAGEVRSDLGGVEFASLSDDPFGLRGLVPKGAGAVLSSSDAAVVLSALVALEGWADEVVLRPHDPASAVDGRLPILGAPTSRLSVDARGATPPIRTRWVLLTSGTTGEPKRVGHRLESLARAAAAAESDVGRVWGLLYEPTRMAGLQVLLHCLHTGESLVAPPVADRLPRRVEHLAASGVTALSATPTMWRQMMQSGIDSSWPLTQITLGGEIADQVLLDELRRRFPAARITHVFAATESGAAFSVSDGRAGFPLRLLEVAGGPPLVRVVDGELEVHSPLSSAASPDGFVRTGDRVVVDDGRVHFLGRSSGTVNIAGVNVAPEHVETLLRQHPAVVDAAVTSRSNPFAGNLLVAEVVLREEVDPSALRRWVRDRATPAHTPARVSVVREIAMTSAGKVRRA